MPLVRLTLEAKTLPKGHFQRRHHPCRHSDERAAERPQGLPDFYVATSLQLSSTIPQKNGLRVIDFFAGLERRYLTHSPPNQEKLQEKYLMKTCSLIAVGAVFMVLTRLASATQADDTTITITGITAGATPFISKLTLQVSSTTVLKSIQFAIDPKPGSVTRPLSGTYSNDYLVSRGFEHPPEVILPVYGLYAGYTNTVRLTYRFLDGSSKQAFTSITTPTFDDQGCGYNNPTKLQPRTNSTNLSYDYIFDSSACGDFSPVILDSDGALRWVSPFRSFPALVGASTFFHGAVYVSRGSTLSRVDLDGSVSLLADYSNLGVESLHHNLDRGKTGLLIEVDTNAWYESVILEVDSADGHLLKIFNMADIISAAMIAGGDDPSQFVFQRTPQSNNDWFHNNAAAYNRADDSVIISSRENFVICIDYKTRTIKWILGDPTKKWHQFPSLRKFALTLAPGSLPPIGQHAISITYDQNLLLFDNGLNSLFPLNQPKGELRTFSSPRKYSLDLVGKIATEVWKFPMDQSVYSPICSSCYEDAPLNYLIDYASVGVFPPPPDGVLAQLLGLDAAGEKIFYYQYRKNGPCITAYNSIPIHLESTKFPTVGPQALNLSTRGLVGTGDNVLIGGFIVSGTDPKGMVLRALGPSLRRFDLSGLLADPVLSVYNSSGTLVAINDNWQTDPSRFFVEANGLAPENPSESAVARTLPPGAYTVIVTGKDLTPGIGLVELYDISTLANAKFGNMSTRGSVGTQDNILINGFIVGDVDSATVIVRALGPTLATAPYGVSGVLSDPTLTIHDSTGSIIASNDNWQDDPNAILVQKNGLTPPDPLESALVLHLPAGAYTAVVRGANDGTGVGLAEVYSLQ
jgi:arylsulfate sulfotransferase